MGGIRNMARFKSLADQADSQGKQFVIICITEKKTNICIEHVY